MFVSGMTVLMVMNLLSMAAQGSGYILGKPGTVCHHADHLGGVDGVWEVHDDGVQATISQMFPNAGLESNKVIILGELLLESSLAMFVSLGVKQMP
jgi:hypothetical protein